MLRRRLGGPKPASEQQQQEDIEHVKEKVGKCISRGLEILYLDEIVFSGEKVPASNPIWAPIGGGMRLNPAAKGGKYIAVMGAASPGDGILHYRTLVGEGFKQDNLIAFMKDLKNVYKPKRIAVFMDNARFHTTDNVKRAATDLGITLIYNLKYRPDLNGLEDVWTHVKAAYK